MQNPFIKDNENCPWLKITGPIPKNYLIEKNDLFSEINKKKEEILYKLKKENYLYITISDKIDIFYLPYSINKINIVTNQELNKINNALIDKIKLETLNNMSCLISHHYDDNIATLKIISFEKDEEFNMISLKDIINESTEKKEIKRKEINLALNKFIPLIEKTLLTHIKNMVDEENTESIFKKPSLISFNNYSGLFENLFKYDLSSLQDISNQLLNQHFQQYVGKGYKINFEKDEIKISLDEDLINEKLYNCEECSDSNLLCNICKIYKKNIALNCGHLFCPKCCSSANCFICSQKIEYKTKIYL